MKYKHYLRDTTSPRKLEKLQTKTALFSFGSLRGLWSRRVDCLWMQLFMAVPMTPSAAVADFGSRRYCRFIPFNLFLSLAAPHLVLVTGNKFIAGVVVTGDNCSPLSLSPVINLSPVTMTPVINLSPVFGTDPDQNRVTWETPSSEPIPNRRKPLRRTRTLSDPAQTQVWSEQVWLNTTFISQGSRSWDKLAVET